MTHIIEDESDIGADINSRLTGTKYHTVVKRSAHGTTIQVAVIDVIAVEQEGDSGIGALCFAETAVNVAVGSTADLTLRRDVMASCLAVVGSDLRGALFLAGFVAESVAGEIGIVGWIGAGCQTAVCVDQTVGVAGRGL